MAPKFGTSGLRGLVAELTDDLVARHVRAFIAACPTGGAVHVGQDLRPSSPAIAGAVAAAVRAAGLEAVDHGALPTPALALASISAGAAAVMVTGSHIPADRNGLKFYVPSGEIGKADEAAILAALDRPAPGGTRRDDSLAPRPGGMRRDDSLAPRPGGMRRDDTALPAYAARYVDSFGPGALAGLKVGIYEHSSVARDVMGAVFRDLGAEVRHLARSDVFIPVDTEAVDPETRDRLAGWARDHRLDAVVSTDGDGDRPMLADATGRIVPGDVLGPLAARFLGADRLVTPVSSNSLIDGMDGFTRTRRCRIGSPFVIAAMEEILAGDPGARVAGYEANGGFLLGFAATAPAGPLAPLMTRDSLLPMVAPLVAARAAGTDLAGLVAALPQRFTAADRIQGVAPAASGALIARMSGSAGARAAFFDGGGTETGIDLTDGLRVSFAGGAVVHLRPSGNAPECRCYAEADSPGTARALVDAHLARLRAALG